MNKSNAPVALITGASSGLGRELAKAYSNGGYTCILSGRNFDGLLETRQALPNWSVMEPGDLHYPDAHKLLADRVGYMGLDHLVLCAASYQKKPFDQITNDDFRKYLADFNATLNLYAAVRDHFNPKGGTILHINSSAGKRYAEHEAPYAAVKHGIAGFLESVRPELVKRNIRVMDVFVGGMKTRMAEGRPDFDKLMDPAEVAEAIFRNVSVKQKTLQMDELHISRFT